MKALIAITGAWLFTSLFFISWNESHHLIQTLNGSTWTAPFGFDAFGRNLLFLTLKGASWSCAFATICVIVAIPVTVALGSWIALAPVNLQALFLRGLDLIIAFPSLVIALAMAAVLGPGWNTLMISLMLSILPGAIRLAFARAQELKIEEFVLASVSMGATRSFIAFRHLMPHLLRLMALKVPNLFAKCLVAESVLSFIGVGAPLGATTWGALIAQGRQYLIEAPHIALFTGAPLLLVTFTLQITSEKILSKN